MRVMQHRPVPVRKDRVAATCSERGEFVASTTTSAPSSAASSPAPENTSVPIESDGIVWCQSPDPPGDVRDHDSL